MKNIHRLADSGKLSVAGPLGENDKNYEGIFIFNVETVEEGQKLLETDPAIQAKLLEANLFSLWCTAALQEIPMLHNSIVKFK